MSHRSLTIPLKNELHLFSSNWAHLKSKDAVFITCPISILVPKPQLFAHPSTVEVVSCSAKIVKLFAVQDYVQKFPDVIVLDPPAAIQHLRNRQSMLQDVEDLKLTDCDGNI